jgi:hypothetical protein
MRKQEKILIIPSMKVSTLDATLTRYQVDQFKTTKGKQIPFEKLGYTIYKPSANMVAFSTNEERILRWIKALYNRYYLGLNDNENITTGWEEQPTYNDPSKCDKIILHLEENSKNSIITITIYNSMGRINIQGQYPERMGKQIIHNFT